ncbi:MAG: hypothetical protein J5372_04245 [Lachnospiraceae bacterium]|nr:hypothetical protein [Lachnospiraceae bacterium]
MKKEDLMELSETIDESYIEEVGKIRMDNGVNKQEEKRASIISIDKESKRGLSKAAVAAIVFACVLVLGGGAVWAMTNSALKDFFFKNSDEQFEKVYTEVGTTFEIGNMNVVYEGSIYDKAVESGYLSFNFYDKEGNPLDIQAKGTDIDCSYTSAGLGRHSLSTGFAVGDDEFHLIFMNLQSVSTVRENNNYLIRFNRATVDGDDYFTNLEFRFLVLNKDQFNSIKEEAGQLDSNALMTFTYDPEADRAIPNYDRDSMQPEIVEILEKYNPYEVQSIDAPAQEFMIGNVKIVVGRTDILIAYNENEIDLDAFTLIRENGERIEFTRKTGSMFSTWTISGMDKKANMGGGSGNDDGSRKLTYNFGFVLGDDEKVKIETNGKVYE